MRSRSQRPSSGSLRPRQSLGSAIRRTRDTGHRQRSVRRARCRRTRRNRFCLTFNIVSRLSRRARAIARRSPLTSVTPALSIATSVPVPIAIPTSASASAGASLTPSPAMATIASALRRLTTSAFCSGRTSAAISSISSCFATASARRSAVACQHDDPNAFTVQGADRAGRGRFDRVGDADESGGLPVRRDEHDGLSLTAQGFGTLDEIAEIHFEAVPSARCCRA